MFLFLKFMRSFKADISGLNMDTKAIITAITIA
jgi:hypothetical protein